MKREVYDCDHCGAKEATCQRIWVQVGEQLAAEGGNYIVLSKPLDLCPTCLAKAVRDFLAGMYDPERARWYAEHKVENQEATCQPKSGSGSARGAARP